MNLLDLTTRRIPPDPWAEGEKIPWHDPAFSARMLHEHLSQEHNAASRRAELIDQHVKWLHNDVLAGAAAKILDLGCGPGLYISALAGLGHSCVGIDYAPASIAYARDEAARRALDCTYIEADVREASCGSGFGLVMMIHGELDVFRPEETRAILERAHQALLPGGHLVMEVHTLAAVQAIGEQEPKWAARESGLFSDAPHLLLKEAYWDAELRVATERYYVVDADSGRVTNHSASIQGRDEETYHRLLQSCGFGKIQTYPSLGGQEGEPDKNYIVLTASTPRFQ